MTKPNDSVDVSPGTGASVGTHSMDSKEYQGVVVVDADGHIRGSKPIYIARIPNQVHVAAASTNHWDLFNADAALLVRILSIKQKPDIVTAVTGVATNWELRRTTSVGTGGTSITPWLPDLSQAALDADITCRSKPTGGAADGVTLDAYQIHSEETNAATQMIRMMMDGGVADLVPKELRDNGHGILLRQNQGIKVVQTTNSSAGNTGWLIGFSVE